MSVKVMARVWAHSRRKDGELLVMLALADFANDEGESWPSIPVLAQKARLTDRQARRVLSKLEQAGEIRCVKDTFYGNEAEFSGVGLRIQMRNSQYRHR